MLIVGAKGLAKQIIEVLNKEQKSNLVFFDEYNLDHNNLWGFYVIHTIYSVIEHFKTIDSRFAVGVGNPAYRAKLTKRFTSYGGELTSIFSPRSHISSKVHTIGNGTIILSNSYVEGDVEIGMGCLLNIFSCVTHDCKVGKYCEISPGAKLLGGCKVGDYCSIGTNAVILPEVILEDNVVVGAGAVVVDNVAKGNTVVGVPAKII